MVGFYSSSVWKGTEIDDLQKIWGLLKVGFLVWFDDSRRLKNLLISVQLYVFCFPEIDSDDLILISTFILKFSVISESQSVMSRTRSAHYNLYHLHRFCRTHVLQYRTYLKILTRWRWSNFSEADHHQKKESSPSAWSPGICDRICRHYRNVVHKLKTLSLLNIDWLTDIRLICCIKRRVLTSISGERSDRTEQGCEIF